MDFDPIQSLPDIRWHETRLTGVSAATTKVISLVNMTSPRLIEGSSIPLMTGMSIFQSGRRLLSRCGSTRGWPDDCKGSFHGVVHGLVCNGRKSCLLRLSWRASVLVNLDRHISSQGGSQDLERPQAVFDDLRANYGDNFRAMMSIVERTRQCCGFALQVKTLRSILAIAFNLTTVRWLASLELRCRR